MPLLHCFYINYMLLGALLLGLTTPATHYVLLYCDRVLNLNAPSPVFVYMKKTLYFPHVSLSAIAPPPRV